MLFDHFWVEAGSEALPEPGTDGSGAAFVRTPTVMGHLRNLARAVLLRRYPILLQVLVHVCMQRCMYLSHSELPLSYE